MRKTLTFLTVIFAVLSLSVPGWATGPQVKAECAAESTLKLTVTNVGPDGTVNGVWGLASREPRLAVGSTVKAGAVITWTVSGLTEGNEYSAGVQLVYPTGTHATDPFKVALHCASPSTTTTVTVPTTDSTTVPATTVFVPPTISIPETVQPSTPPVTDTAEGITGTEATTTVAVSVPVRLPATGADATMTMVLFAGGFLVIGVLLLAARRRVSTLD